MERCGHERRRSRFFHFPCHFHFCHELAHFNHNVVKSGFIYQDFLHQTAHVVHKPETVSSHGLGVVCYGLHLCLRDIVILYHPDHQLPLGIVIEGVIPCKVDLSAVRALPEEKRTVFDLLPEFRIFRRVDALVDLYYVALSAFGADRFCIVDNGHVFVIFMQI